MKIQMNSVLRAKTESSSALCVIFQIKQDTRHIVGVNLSWVQGLRCVGTYLQPQHIGSRGKRIEFMVSTEQEFV